MCCYLSCHADILINILNCFYHTYGRVLANQTPVYLAT